MIYLLCYNRRRSNRDEHEIQRTLLLYMMCRLYTGVNLESKLWHLLMWIDSSDEGTGLVHPSSGTPDTQSTVKRHVSNSGMPAFTVGTFVSIAKNGAVMTLINLSYGYVMAARQCPLQHVILDVLAWTRRKAFGIRNHSMRVRKFQSS